MTGELVLIVEDEVIIADILSGYLNASGYQTYHLSRGDEVLDWVNKHRPRAILIDRMLPGRDGLDICRDIRAQSDTPLMMITARTSEDERLEAFNVGVDDYVCKPFSPREVTARIQALLRRAAMPADVNTTAAIVLNLSTYCVEAKGRQISLTSIEFKMLQIMMKATGRIFTRNEIMDRVYEDYRVVNDRTIDSHIKKLRRKLEDLKLERQPLHSVYGIGYKFDP